MLRYFQIQTNRDNIRAMNQPKVSFRKWLTLSPQERRSIYDSWNRYRGEGKDILKCTYRSFKKELARSKDIVNISYGLYHGGDWVISVTVRVGHSLKISEQYLGFRIIKLYDGLAERLKYMLHSKYNDDIVRFVEGERSEFRKCFNFTSSPHAKKWLVNFVREHGSGAGGLYSPRRSS